MASLNQEEILHFSSDGYVLPSERPLSHDKFAQLVEVFEEDLARYGADDLDVIHVRDKRLFDFLFDDSVLDMVEALIGPNIGLWSSHFITKPPRTGKATPWHEDASYWEGRMDNWSQTLTLWLAIDNVDRENGCMRVVPGTHLTPPSEYVDEDEANAIFNRKIAEGTVDVDTAVDLARSAGMCSIHDARIVHGAEANTSDRRRAGYTMRYFPTTCRVIPEANPDHKVWLARGHDIAGNPFVNA